MPQTEAALNASRGGKALSAFAARVGLRPASEREGASLSLPYPSPAPLFR